MKVLKKIDHSHVGSTLLSGSTQLIWKDVLMDRKQLGHLALQVRLQNNGTYRGKSLCQTCLMEKASITAPEDQLEFEQVWHEWVKMLARDRCTVCGEQKETMTLPAN